MRKCLSCYRPLEEAQSDYHPACARAFFGTTTAPMLPYRLSEMAALAKETVERSITVPGVQPKLSLGRIRNELYTAGRGRLTVPDALKGEFILKPPFADYPQLPENEHLSMKLAGLFTLDTVPPNLIRLASGELCYITKRIDRNPDGTKNHMIDFQQILELEDKYKGTMELVGKTIGELSVNTLLDKLRFFESAVFNFIIGNNDMHLKNYSMFLSGSGWVLSPCYDLLNVKIILPKDQEDLALLLGGKKANFEKSYFDRLGDYLNLNAKQVNAVYKRLLSWLPRANQLIDASFLNEDRKSQYKNLLAKRVKIFQTDPHVR